MLEDCRSETGEFGLRKSGQTSESSAACELLFHTKGSLAGRKGVVGCSMERRK